jgi:DNA repair exonuclease SbcCD ATPase subunit
VLQVGGADALKLAEARLKISEEIADIERKANEAKRQLAISEAESRREAAARKKAEVDSGTFNAAQDVKGQEQGLSEILGRMDELSAERLAKIADIEQQIATKQAALDAANKTLDEGIPNEFAVGQAKALVFELVELRKRLPEAARTPDEFGRLAAESDAKQASLDESAQVLADLSKQQEAAAKALTDATLALRNLRESQGVERDAESRLEAARRERDKIADVGAKGTTAVDSLTGLLESVGESGGKDLAPFVSELSSILKDRAISADELARLPALLASYFGKVARLGDAQNKAISDGIARIDELERAAKNLSANAGKTNF